MVWEEWRVGESRYGKERRRERKEEKGERK